MFFRSFCFRFLLTFLALGLGPLWAETAKRPLNASDIDGWRNFSANTLSANGEWLAYADFPQHGNGEIVMLHLESNREIRVPAGAIPPLPFPRPTHPDERRPKPESPGIFFTSDNRFLLSTTFPTAETLATLRQTQRKNNPTFSRKLVITDLVSGKSQTIPAIKSVQVPTRGGSWAAYLHSPNPRTPKTTPALGATLVIRNLQTGKERRFSHVTEYQFARDGRTLLYVVSSPKKRKNGVYAYSPETNRAPRAILRGKGHYLKFTWNQAQTQAAFLKQPEPRGSAEQAPPQLFLWNRSDKKATRIDTSTWSTGSTNLQLSKNSTLRFTRDDRKLIVSLAAPPVTPESPSLDPADLVAADIWSGHDGLIQPRQAVLSGGEKKRTYTGLYELTTQRYTQLADPEMAEVILSENGDYALGCDYRPYLRLRDFDGTYGDIYTVDTTTGQRQLVIEKLRGSSGDEGKPSLRLSPDGRHALYFQNDHWHLLDLTNGRTRNLTATLPESVAREFHDKPEPNLNSGWAGWNHDSQFVVVYSRYDAWKLFTDGRPAENLTRGYGRKHRLILRVQNITPREKGIPAPLNDFSKTLLLRGEDEPTRATGYFEFTPGTDKAPRRLLWGDKSYRYAGRALQADRLMLTVQRYNEFPDFWITDSQLSTLRKVTDGGAQLKPFLWGSAELINYQNSQGVPLQAALYKPDNFDPTKKYPLIVYTYERLSQIVHQFFSPVFGSNISFPLYTSNGYLVMLADIAYTEGHPGPSALDSVNAALDAVIARGFVDENALGIQGSSWGGYTASYLITQTQRFRAASGGAIVSNMTSAYGGIRNTSGQARLFQYEQSQSRIGKTLVEAPELFLENSPIFHVKNVQTPFLIMHNDRDGAVPFAQAVEFYLTLRRYDKPVWLINYLDEGHGISRLANRKDFSKRMWQFFDHYLRGAPAPDWLTQGVPYLDRDEEKLRFNRDEIWPAPQEP